MKDHRRACITVGTRVRVCRPGADRQYGTVVVDTGHFYDVKLDIDGRTVTAVLDQMRTLESLK